MHRIISWINSIHFKSGLKLFQVWKALYGPLLLLGPYNIHIRWLYLQHLQYSNYK